MLRFSVLVFLCVAHVSCYPRHEQEEARVLSEVWEAMDKHRGDDIIVIPRHDGPESGPEHHSSDRRSSDHHHEPSHDGPSYDGPSHDGPSSSDRSESERKSSETESTSESSEKSDSSAATSDAAADTTADAQSSSSSGSSERSDESSRGHSSEGSYDKMWNKFNRLGDMMNRAVDRLRKDDREIRELEKEGSSSSNGPTVFILEVVGAVVVGLILVGLLVLGTVKGVKGLKSWKARRQSERLVDQEAPNMDGTGYQSGYNP